MTVHELRAVDLGVCVLDIPVLRHVELVASSGAWTTISGPSGSGKSLLLQTLAGLLPAGHGVVLVDGHPAWTGPHRQPTPGIVLQDDALVSFLTSAETVALPLQARGQSRSAVDDHVRGWLRRLGLEATADQLVSTLSGGQRQRVAMARTLAMDSPLLFLDEPTSELDTANRQLVLTQLREQTNRGAILIIVTHDPAILEMSDTVLTLSPEGRLRG